VEAHEIAEKIHETEPGPHGEGGHEMFRRLTAIYVGVVAMLLAISTLGGAEATKEMLNANIQASDTYSNCRPAPARYRAIRAPRRAS
jgi:hypothetical protein